MSSGQEYLTKKEAMNYKLEILNSLLPLLSPTLLPSHTTESPSTTDTTLHAHIHAAKRKHDEEKPPVPAAIHGLGLGLAAGVKLEPDVKRVRTSLPPKPTTFSVEPPSPDLGLPASLGPARVRSDNVVVPSPLLGGPRGEAFPLERLRVLAVTYREKGREVKHAGDKTRRDGRSNALATIQQADAVLLFVFSYWCDDQARKTTTSTNWQSVHGLLDFVKTSAVKAKLDIVLGLCLRIEAHCLHRIFLHEQKLAIHRASQLTLPPSPALHPIHSLPGTSNESSRSPQSQPSPAAHSPPHPHPGSASSDVLHSFVKAGNELFRYHRLWEEGCTLVSPSVLGREAPRTWKLATEVMAREREMGDLSVPMKPWRFAWPTDLQRTFSIVHEVAFARAVLEEVAERAGLGYACATVPER